MVPDIYKNNADWKLIDTTSDANNNLFTYQSLRKESVLWGVKRLGAALFNTISVIPIIKNPTKVKLQYKTGWSRKDIKTVSVAKDKEIIREFKAGEIHNERDRNILIGNKQWQRKTPEKELNRQNFLAQHDEQETNPEQLALGDAEPETPLAQPRPEVRLEQVEHQLPEDTLDTLEQTDSQDTSFLEDEHDIDLQKSSYQKYGKLKTEEFLQKLNSEEEKLNRDIKKIDSEVKEITDEIKKIEEEMAELRRQLGKFDK